MKTIFPLLFTCLFAFSGIAQQSVSDCHTLKMRNGEKVKVIIDSITSNMLYFKDCENPTQSLKTDLLTIKKIIDREGKTDPRTTMIKNIQRENKAKALVDSRIEKWWFKHKTRNLRVPISNGQKVKVFYKKHKGLPVKEEGICKSITNEALIFLNYSEVERTIPRNKIVHIQARVEKKFNLWKGLGIIFLGLLGLLISFVAAFNNILSPSQSSIPKIGAILSGVFILAGLSAITYSYKSINYPFSGDWEIEYVKGDGMNTMP